MKIHQVTTAMALTALIFQITDQSARAQETMTPGAAKLLYDVKRAEIQKPLKELQEKYNGALSRLQETEQSKGNLEAVLLLKKEAENFKTRSESPEPAALPALNSLREIYYRELGNIEETQKKAESVAFAHFKRTLNDLISDLTREGKVEEAIKTRDMLAEIESATLHDSSSAGPSEEVVVGEEENFTLTTKLDLTKQDNLYVISSDSNADQAIYSKRSFKTPFTIQAKAMTDGGNIRFYFAQHGIVIFNWEMNPKELRINEPVGKGKHGIRGTKPLDADRMYDLEIRVTESKIAIYAGRRKYGEVDGDFAEAEGTVGIGPAFGSTVSVERLVGIQE